MTALRLAVVSDAVHPWNKGGKELRYHELLRRLSQHGIRVDVYTMNWWGTGGTVQVDGVAYHAICPLLPLYSGERRSIRQALLFSLASLRLITKRFDVLEADVIPFLPVFPLRLVATLRRRPFVVTWHELWGRAYWRRYLGLRGELAALLESWAISLPDRIIAASAGTAGRITTDARTPVDVTIVPNGINPAEIASNRTETAAATTTSATGLKADVLIVGRLLEHKNVHLALDALALLAARGHRLTATVIGTGPEAGRLAERAAELGISQDVRFAGAVPERADVLAAMHSAGLLLFPSVREGFGIVALEALACGLPVVTTDHPDNFARELVTPGSNGELCRPEAASIAAALERVLARREEMSGAAVRSARDYDWDDLAAAAAKVYAA